MTPCTRDTGLGAAGARAGTGRDHERGPAHRATARLASLRAGRFPPAGRNNPRGLVAGQSGQLGAATSMLGSLAMVVAIAGCSGREPAPARDGDYRERVERLVGE